MNIHIFGSFSLAFGGVQGLKNHFMSSKRYERGPKSDKNVSVVCFSQNTRPLLSEEDSARGRCCTPNRPGTPGAQP